MLVGLVLGAILRDACSKAADGKPPRRAASAVAKLFLVATCTLAYFLGSASAQTPTGSPGEGAVQPATQAPVTNPSAPVGTPSAVQQPNPSPAITGQKTEPPVSNPLPALETSVWQKQGTRVEAVRFEGVTFSETDPIVSSLQQKAGQPLDASKVRADLRSLFASGRYRDMQVTAQQSGSGIALVYSGTPRYYVGRVEIAGVPNDRLASLLEFATKLDPGTPYTEAEIPTAVDGVKQSLAQNGYFQPVIKADTSKDDFGQQVNTRFTINIGPKAVVGTVALEGKDPGIGVTDFRKKGGLDCSKLTKAADKLLRKQCQIKVERDTVSTALSGVRGYYQKKERLEGTISLQEQAYEASKKRLNYRFAAEQGPVVHVVINGVKVSKSRKQLLVPIYQESAVDNDLINEGSYNIKDFLQQQGYFDVDDTVKVTGEKTPVVTVQYDVVPGKRHRVSEVNIKGNKYFSRDLIDERLRVKKADLYQRNGVYSAQLVTADSASIQALYRASGFTQAKVTANVKDIETGPHGEPLKLARIDVTYVIEEGPQQKFGAVDLAGIDPSREAAVKGLVSAEVGQPFSLITLSNDRDAVLSYYLSNGFDHAKVEIVQKVETDTAKTDVILNITEGQQVSIDHVLLSGIKHTKPSLVNSQLEVRAGQPLDQSALLQTQRNLYNLALFSEVNAAVQNPTGNALRKNVLVQLTEAKRWDVTYGFGFEAQTGTPAVVPGSTRGSTAAQNGKAGASPRVSLDVSRINFRGTQESLTLHTSFGLLERVATLSFNNPQLLGHKNLTGTISGGYSNVQNISTFQASTLQGDFRVSQRYKKADTFIYDFQYRRVSVDPNSLEITPNLIAQLSQPVTVGGPGLTYFHDTRDPSPLNATKGQYFSMQEFVSDSIFGAATNFNRLDVSHASYYTFGKRNKYTFARNLRVGFENTFGNTNAASNSRLGIANCTGTLLTTNATCNPIPLPERLYAGGATSHRGFGINDAGPRDLTTGYPVGGSGVVVNSFELRLPPPTLPIVGNSVSFVLFHDMGNVFRYPGDMFKSIKNFRQPDEATCHQVPPKGEPIGILENLSGNCNFNYYSHAVGLGARYNTPVGPIRLDFSYNLNPPVYPVFYDYTANSPYVGQATHFNFFFSIGQAF